MNSVLKSALEDILSAPHTRAFAAS
ncbi:hypothetical protein FAIPA1_410029 [Frankia sp. AiPs1]